MLSSVVKIYGVDPYSDSSCHGSVLGNSGYCYSFGGAIRNTTVQFTDWHHGKFLKYEAIFRNYSTRMLLTAKPNIISKGSNLVCCLRISFRISLGICTFDDKNPITSSKICLSESWWHGNSSYALCLFRDCRTGQTKNGNTHTIFLRLL